MTIKELRLKKGFTQAEAAAALGISRRAYQYLEGEDADVGSAKYAHYMGMLDAAPSKDPFLLRLRMDAIYGNQLNELFDGVKNYRKRYCYDALLDYIHNDYRGRVCILYGLRRTGKTTMLFQLLGELDPSKTVYIKAKDSNTMGDLVKDLNLLRSKGFRNVLIDEITLLEDFIGSSATLSDLYSIMGMKIILSGTDSLGFAFADREELYDRSLTIHTSYISFKEFSDVLGIDEIDTYIEYGGTLRPENIGFDDPDAAHIEAAFSDDETTRKYIDTAIAKNIQRSLRNKGFGDGFAHLKDLYEADELTNVINRIVQNMNHDFLLRVVRERFKSSDLGSARQLLLHNEDPEAQTALYDVDEKAILNRMKELLEIVEAEDAKTAVSVEAMDQIKTYLFMLDLIREVVVEHEDGRISRRIVFTQPGMRYAIVKALVHSLMQDPFFNRLNYTAKETIVEKILSDVKGRMLEDIVLLETASRQKGILSFKFSSFRGGEYDLVTFDPKEKVCRVYEIKHSAEVSFENQTRYLRDAALATDLERLYGPIAFKGVLYRGKTHVEQGIDYRNVAEFLKSI